MPDRRPLAELVSIEPGAIAVTSPQKPASFSFDPAQGKIESAGEGAGNAARAVLTTPNLGHAQLEAVVGTVEFVLAPFAAGYGAISAAQRKIPADKLAAAERSLAQAMNSMAAQEHLWRLLLETAGAKTRRHLVPLDPTPAAPLNCGPVSALVETRVEQLRLERTGASDSTYALRINARARMVRASDGAVLFDRPYEYRSGQDMFIDWARPGGLETVAQTAYRHLAEQMAKELFSSASEAPILLGAGYKISPSRRPEPRPVLVANRALPAHPRTQFVNYPVANSGSFEVYSTGPAANIHLQEPLTKDEAVTEAQEETAWMLDGLETHRNFVVQFVSCVAAVPIGLWKQTAGAVRGVPDKELAAADARLKAVARQMQPRQVLATEVAQRLASQTSEPVLLAKEPLPSWPEDGPALMQCDARATTAWSSPISHVASVYPAEQGTGTALEIHVLQAKLSGKSGVNPRLALCLEAQATLYRTSDGQQLYSCPVSYRSTERQFAGWAARDARLFRQELEQCYREMSNAIVDQLIARGLVPPGQRPYSTIAKN